MSFFDRLLGGGRSKAHAEGLALLESGQFAEAVDLLRRAALDRSDSPTGSLASFHFRQALLAEGRRLIRAKDFSAACQPLAEAVGLWEMYPDLHCAHGAACGFSGNWDFALAEARAALRINPDYTEARLLEAFALQTVGRAREAAESLNSLTESGRRVGHWLIDSLEHEGQFTEESLPEDLGPLLLKCLSGRSEKEEIAEAVAMCRGGDWEPGLAIFKDLVERRPRYPDYRTRLAGALFQVGRLDEALAEVEAALGLNDSYAGAIDLKGLILADQGQVHQARVFLADADERLADNQTRTPHEELFGAYLRAVLALIAGDPEQVPLLLDSWPELLRTFARAELLLAAADDLRGRAKACSQRLTDLSEEWSGEALYYYLLACHHLDNRRYSEVSDVLSRWPAAKDKDRRPRFLECSLAVCLGEVPELPEIPDQKPASEPGDVPHEAWQFLAARVAYLQGDDRRCWDICADLTGSGFGSERSLRLQLAAAGNLSPDDVPALKSWQPSFICPDSCQAQYLNFKLGGHEKGTADGLVRKMTAAHPENLRGCWLSPEFWLEPVRSWIA